MTGPERASGNFQRIANESLTPNSLEDLLKEFFQNTIEYYLQIFEVTFEITQKTNVHKSHPMRFRHCSTTEALSQKRISTIKTT